MEHEWEEEEHDGGSIGHYSIYRCKNCGGVVVDLFFYGRGKPKRIIVGGSIPRKYLTQDCLESLKIMQTYWEKEGKKKPVYNKDYRRYNR